MHDGNRELMELLTHSSSNVNRGRPGWIYVEGFVHHEACMFVLQQRWIAMISLSLLGAWSSGPQSGQGSVSIPHTRAVEGVLRILDSVPLVAIGDLHGASEAGTFYQQLVRHPDFPGKANDLILEMGNETYQGVADRYVNGVDVPLDSVRMIWENTTQGPLLTSTLPMYTSLFTAVREVNSKLPPQRRIRILLGDPGVEWKTVTRDELWKIHARRGDLMRELARDSVLAKGRRGVMIAGFRHLGRQPREGSDAKWGELSSKVFVIRPHDGFGGSASRHEPSIDSLSPYSLVRLRDSWVGDLAVDEVDDATPAPDGGAASTRAPASPTPRTVNAGRKLRDVADGYLYLGPFRSLTSSRADLDRIRNDPARLRDIQTRSCMMMGRSLDTASIYRTPQSNLLYRTGRRPSQVEYERPAPSQAPPPLPANLGEPCTSLLQSR